MKNFKKLNRLFESVDNSQMLPEIAACNMSDFMSKLDACCANNPELKTKVDSLKATVGQICMEPEVIATFTQGAMMPTSDAMPQMPTDDASMAAPADAVPTFGEFANQADQENMYNVPTFGAQ